MRDEALSRALAPRGNSSRIAEAIGVTAAAIAQWTRCPPEHARTVEAITGVPRHELRPDLWEVGMPSLVPPTQTSSGKAEGNGFAEALPAFGVAPKSSVRIALEEAQAILRRYVDPSDSLSEELIRDRREAAGRGE